MPCAGVDINKKNFKPPVQAIKERYYSKHRGGAAGPSVDRESLWLT